MHPEFLVVDGHNLSYRSHFALVHLDRGDGPPTHALLGFVKSLRALERARRPTHHVVAFDGGLCAERLRQCPEYKAQRPPMPDALRAQLPLIYAFLEAAAIPFVRIEGQEADDLIATLARRAEKQGASVSIVSSDKDLCQLIGERIRVVNPAAPEVPLDAEAVRGRFGVPPERLAEWLALTGDSADNIEGVPGVGPVTAAKWLAAFGSLDALLERVDEVRPARLQAALRASRTRVERNRELIRLHEEVPGLPEWTTFAVQGGRDRELAGFFRSVNLPSLLPAVAQPTLFDAEPGERR